MVISSDYASSAGDEVITAANSFIVTEEASLLVGAQPVFVDVDPRTRTIDTGQIDVRITPRTRAIIPVRLRPGP